MLVKISIRLRKFTKMQVKQIDQTPKISLGTHTRKIDRIRTTKEWAQNVQPREMLLLCECSRNTSSISQWARYACAPTYERTVPSSIPTMLYMRWPKWYNYANGSTLLLTSSLLLLFCLKAFLLSFFSMLDARAEYDMTQVYMICTGETYGTKMITRSLWCTIAFPGNSQLASLDG